MTQRDTMILDRGEGKLRELQAMASMSTLASRCRVSSQTKCMGNWAF